MTTRTKIGVCVGVLVVAVAVGVVPVRSFRTGPAVTVSFVRYRDAGSAVLSFTNLATIPIHCITWTVHVGSDTEFPSKVRSFVVLLPRSDTQFVVWPHSSGPRLPFPPARLDVTCSPQPGWFRRRMDNFLREGLKKNPLTRPFDVSVDLPPRPATPSSGPTNQNAP